MLTNPSNINQSGFIILVLCIIINLYLDLEVSRVCKQSIAKPVAVLLYFRKAQLLAFASTVGSTVTRSKIEDEQRDALHNRGNFLRMRGEYDRALSVFEQLIALDDTDADAHWNAALCRYGIEYVKDPESGKRIPTCHRANWDSILSDVDYLAAIHFADPMARKVYETDGKYIDEVQKNILAISRTEEPYDIFICYKETLPSRSMCCWSRRIPGVLSGKVNETVRRVDES